jgi:uncharacterized protein (TIGR02594 family)
MQIVRRSLLLGVSSMLTARGIAAISQPFKRLFLSIPDGIGVLPDYTGPLPKPGTLGTTPATAHQVDVADSILAKAPRGPNPFDVASFFLAVGNGDFNPEWKPYTKGWPTEWNPVIVRFFEATHTKPEGDVTAWCAAFVNWCSRQSGKKELTGSASSGSFRTFGVETQKPLVGDLVVFQRTDIPKTQKGHVGFFVDGDDHRVLVLGGNQIEGVDRCHMISKRWLRKRGRILSLHSYRTDPRLHS